jgi:uncharacterized surface protein with fasciclin (FAS1) repeats
MYLHSYFIKTLTVVIRILGNKRLVQKLTNKNKYIMNIVETTVNHGSFKTLVTAVKAADFVETLTSEGPFTVFAPMDDAFGKLPKGTVETLVKP